MRSIYIPTLMLSAGSKATNCRELKGFDAAVSGKWRLPFSKTNRAAKQDDKAIEPKCGQD
jgi:hypothetical protein